MGSPACCDCAIACLPAEIVRDRLPAVCDRAIACLRRSCNRGNRAIVCLMAAGVGSLPCCDRFPAVIVRLRVCLLRSCNRLPAARDRATGYLVRAIVRSRSCRDRAVACCVFIGSPETRVFILVALARVNASHWFNIMTRLASCYRK